MKITTKKWDASEHLDNPELIREYLKASFEDGDTEQLLKAIGNVAKAKGMTDIAKETNLNRQNLYRALEAGSTPKFDTIKKIVEALGCKISIA